VTNLNVTEVAKNNVAQR